MQDWNELQAFLAVARTASFTKSAERLGLPKSTVSRFVQRLEDRLGVRLLERSTRRVALTPAGERFLEHASRMHSEAEQAEATARELRATPRGPLRVAMPVTFARTFLAPVLPQFLRQYPGVQLHISLGLSGTDPAALKVDLLIRAGGPVDDSSVLSRRLREVPVHLYASVSYLSRMGAPQHPRDLTQHECCALDAPAAGALWRVHRAGKTEVLRITPRLAVADPVLGYAVMKAGVAIAAAPDFLARDDENAGRVVRVLPEWNWDPVEITALYPSRQGLLPHTRAFLDFLAARLPAVRP